MKRWTKAHTTAVLARELASLLRKRDLAAAGDATYAIHKRIVGLEEAAVALGIDRIQLRHKANRYREMTVTEQRHYDEEIGW